MGSIPSKQKNNNKKKHNSETFPIGNNAVFPPKKYGGRFCDKLLICEE